MKKKSIGPIGGNGHTLNPSSFWVPTGAKEPSEILNERRAQETVSRVRNGLQLIRRSNTSPEILKAKFEMAQRYRYGWGVPVNYSESLKLYRSAASSGHAGAGYELARLYLQGDVLMRVGKDLERAKKTAESTLQKTGEAALDQKSDIAKLRSLEAVITSEIRQKLSFG